MSRVAVSDRILNPDIENSVLDGVLHGGVSLTPGPETEVLLVWHQIVDRTYLDQLPNLRYIIRYGVGFDKIDLNAAGERGIRVSNTPDYCTDEVADSALAMILAISRGIHRYDNDSRTYSKGWQENVYATTKRTSETKLGIIGAGRIGQSVILRAKALKYQAMFFDPFLPNGVDKVLGARRCENLQELLAEADIVSLHVPLNDNTKNMVDKEFLAKMKPGASFVNTARGGVVSDLDVFYAPLRSGQLQNVALDVLPSEPPQPGQLIDAWRSREAWLGGRLIINPHAAFHSDAAQHEMREKAAKNALRYLLDQPLRDIVGG